MWRIRSDASFRGALRDSKVDKTKQIANILRDIPPHQSRLNPLKLERAVYSDMQNSSAPPSHRELEPALTYRSRLASQQESSVWNDAKHRDMMDRMSNSLQQCQQLLVSFRKKVATKAVKLPPLHVPPQDVQPQPSSPQAIWISAPAISSLFTSLSQGDVSSRGSISLSEWLKFCKDTDCFSKLNVTKSDCSRAFHLATASDRPGRDHENLDLEKFCQCLIFLAHLAGIFPGLGVDSLPSAINCDPHTSRCISVLLLKLLAHGIEADFDILSLSSESQPRGLPSAQPSPRTARIAMQGRGSTASTSSVAAQQMQSHAPSVDGEVFPIWNLITGLDAIFASVALSDPGLLGAVGSRSRSVSMIEWLKFCKEYDAYAKLHLSKTDCVRAFQLANSVGNSDGDTHEMDLEEFSQCLLFLAKMSGFLGEGDNVPLASQCSVAVAESVSKLLLILGCIVPEGGNRSSRHLARLKRHGSKGSSDSLVSTPSRAQLQQPLTHVENGARKNVLGSGELNDENIVEEVKGVDLSRSPLAAAPTLADQRLLNTDVGASRLSGNLAGNSDAAVDGFGVDQEESLNGGFERAAIAALQSDFRDMNLLPQQKWGHFAGCLAQAGVSTLRDLLHLGSEDDALVKFLGETCGMNVIQGKKVVAFLKAT